ncbi:TolC family protein [Variovorax terrae]|uniref:TolC family protein n=1 Tax=Variovorax terrae TaxID=2923278 RepID=A0A9X2APM9_9BURK|nr:TolC family protein [Variovorax terrae]MCJ0765065.1 TolC family protein [Variovorax terrae]
MNHHTLRRARLAGLASALLWAGLAPAQPAGLPDTAAAAAPAIRFRQYLDAVEQHSLDLAAQRETITAARAGVTVAGVRPDPNLSIGMGPKEFSSAVNPKPPVARSIGLDWTVETGGKRDKRIQAAQSNVRLTEATVEGFRHQLYSDSAGAFAEACRTREALARQQSTLQALSEVVRANEARRKAGDVGGLELLQSRVERDQFQAVVDKARADAQAAQLGLSVPLGRRFAELFGAGALECGFEAFVPGQDLEALVRQGLRARDDVLIARAALDSARANEELVQANRHVDPTLGLSYSRTPTGPASIDADGNLVDGSPRSRTLSVTLSIPIPFSRLQRGELIQAASAVTQAMLGLNQAELKAEADVRVAHTQFLAARDNLRRYRESVLADADRVLEGMRLSYRKGAASLLELLAAQRSADEAYLASLQAQADLASATVQLQLSLGQRPAL